MKSIFFVSLLLFLPGCIGMGVRPSYVREGRQVFEATCNGMARSIADCHKQASTQCNGYYDEVDREGNARYAAMGGQIVTVQNRTMYFVCKPPLEAPQMKGS